MADRGTWLVGALLVVAGCGSPSRLAPGTTLDTGGLSESCFDAATPIVSIFDATVADRAAGIEINGAGLYLELVSAVQLMESTCGDETGAADSGLIMWLAGEPSSLADAFMVVLCDTGGRFNLAPNARVLCGDDFK